MSAHISTPDFRKQLQDDCERMEFERGQDNYLRRECNLVLIQRTPDGVFCMRGDNQIIEITDLMERPWNEIAEAIDKRFQSIS